MLNGFMDASTLRALRQKLPLKRIFLGLAAIAVVGFGVIQLVPYGRAHANPPVLGEPAWDSPRTRELTVRACFACHSNEVDWPWYSNIAPISWYVQNHVDEGRDELNFSEWTRPQKEADESAETVRDGEMPPGYYTLGPLNSSASLTAAEKAELVRGLVATFGESNHDDERFEDDGRLREEDRDEGREDDGRLREEDDD